MGHGDREATDAQRAHRVERALGLPLEDVEGDEHPIELTRREGRVVNRGRDRMRDRRADDGRQFGMAGDRPVRTRAIRAHPQSFSRTQTSFAARNAFSVSAKVCPPLASANTYHNHLPSAGFRAASIDFRLGAAIGVGGKPLTL